MAPGASVVDAAGVDRLIAALRSDGYLVLGPIVRDGAIVVGELDGVGSLPRGWGDEQAPGHYRLVARDDGALFGFAAPASGWKAAMHPPRSLQWTAALDDPVTVTPADHRQPQPLALFGLRPCDLAALTILDRVRLGGVEQDPEYAARRLRAFVVVAECTTPAATCFCPSTGTGPAAAGGFDVALTEVGGTVLVRTGSARGAALVARVETRPATASETEAAAVAIRGAERAMGHEHLDRAAVIRTSARTLADEDAWIALAERCTACGACTASCPTCFCTATEHRPSLDGRVVEQWQRWDSCFTEGFAYVHGGSVRPTTAARYRQWFTHKLVTWGEQWGTAGCVGCGRCVTWCPVGIDITAAARALIDRSVP